MHDWRLSRYARRFDDAAAAENGIGWLEGILRSAELKGFQSLILAIGALGFRLRGGALFKQLLLVPTLLDRLGPEQAGAGEIAVGRVVIDLAAFVGNGELADPLPQHGVADHITDAGEICEHRRIGARGAEVISGNVEPRR